MIRLPSRRSARFLLFLGSILLSAGSSSPPPYRPAALTLATPTPRPSPASPAPSPFILHHSSFSLLAPGSCPATRSPDELQARRPARPHQGRLQHRRLPRRRQRADGFHLSLFGYDPDGDYDRITREMGARRVNLAMPEESLLLLKATGSVPHTGGKRFDTASDFYKAVFQWLDAGAPHDPPNVPKVTSVRDRPDGNGASRARTSPASFRSSRVTRTASVRDVTPLAVFYHQ